jgi:hypothetical protein
MRAIQIALIEPAGAAVRRSCESVASTNSPTCALSASSEIFDGNGNSVAALLHDSTVATCPWACSTSAAKRDNRTVKVSFVDGAGKTLVNTDGFLFDSQVSFTPGASATIDASPVRNGQLRGIAGDSAGASERGCIAATMRGSWKLLIAR